MAEQIAERKRRTIAEVIRQIWLDIRLLVFGILFAAGLTLIQLLPVLPRNQQLDIQLGSVLTDDVVAQRELSYVSEILATEAQEQALESVSPIYDPPDPRISRQQVRRAGQIMSFIQDVRNDSFASDELQLDYVDRILFVDLPNEISAVLLNLPEGQYQLVTDEVISLVETAMSDTIREGEENTVVSTLQLRISADLPDELIAPVTAVASDLIVANSRLNLPETEQARVDALANIPEQRRTFRPGETVVPARVSISDLDVEALEVMGLTSSQLTWQRTASAILASIMAVLALIIYLVSYQSRWLQEPRYLFLFGLLFLAFVFMGQTILPNGDLAYLFPAAALALVFAPLMGLPMTVLATVILAAFAGLLSDRTLELTVYSAAMGIFAAGSLRSGARLNQYFLSGLFASLVGVAILLVFRLPFQQSAAEIGRPLLFAVLNGMLSAGLALVLLFVIGNITNLTTSIQLIDLIRPDHPLQKKLQQEAIGTYHHTLAVANLVEAACEAIGANTLLARAGALYHDVGKTVNPGFFIENRIGDWADTHSHLSPEESARIIISHVTEGVKMAKEHRLPNVIIDFIKEHHGTRPVIYFLTIARKRAETTGEELDEEQFYYPGPRPQSRETAALMLADSCESATRANRPSDKAEVATIVDGIITDNLERGQLDDSGLTLTDIQTIRETLIYTLQGIYHPRIKYPGGKSPKQVADTEDREIEAGEEPATPIDSTLDTALEVHQGVDPLETQPIIEVDAAIIEEAEREREKRNNADSKD